MRVVLLCATHRGYLFLRQLHNLIPEHNLVVFSFREESWEPLFLDDIRNLALAQGGQIFESKHVGSHRNQLFWESTDIDLMLVVGWRYMIPRDVYRRPRNGTFVFHDSLLPAYRGFAPTVWAIVNGEDHTGVTLFEIAEQVDAGDIVAQQRVPIDPEDTIAVVMQRVTQAYLDLLKRNLESLMSGGGARCQQDHSKATYTCKRTPDDNWIDWTASCGSIYNLIRAVSAPYPGAYTYLSGRKMRVWSAQRVSVPRYAGRIPGKVVEVCPGVGSVVLSGDGALLITKVQLDSGPVLCASDVLKSITQTLGDRLPAEERMTHE